MSRTRIAVGFLVSILAVGFLALPKTSAQWDQSGFAADPAAESQSVMPAWWQWVSSEEGRRALHHSPHLAAPGLLRALGEDPTITIIPALSKDTSTDISPPITTFSCPGNGVQFNREPKNGDSQALFLGLREPYDKYPNSIDFGPAAGRGQSDFIVTAADDSGGLWGRNGGSNSMMVFHFKNAVSGTPDCLPNVEMGLPSVVDGNGVTDSGFAGSRVVYDIATNTFFAVDIGMGSTTTGAENAVRFFATNPTTVESAACNGTAEGETKNENCWPTRFPISSFSFNFTMNTGVQFQQVDTVVERIQSSDYVVTAFSAHNLAASTWFLDLAACKEPVTGPASCSPLGGGTFTSVPITGFHMTVLPSGKVLFGESEGSAASQTLNTFTCDISGFPSSPTCGTKTMVSTFTPVTRLRGQPTISVFTPPSVAAGGSNIFVTTPFCTLPLFSSPAISDECSKSQLEVWTSADGGVTWNPFAMPSMLGNQFGSDIVADSSGNAWVSFFSTGKDATGQSEELMFGEIPSSLGSPTFTTVTPKVIDSSAGFSTGGTRWGGVAASPFRNNTIYLHFPSTNFFGNVGTNTNMPKETNAITQIEGP